MVVFWHPFLSQCRMEAQGMKFHNVLKYRLRSTGWCSTPTLLLICSSFSRENGHPLLIYSSLSTAQSRVYCFFSTHGAFFGRGPTKSRLFMEKCRIVMTCHDDDLHMVYIPSN